MSTTVSHDAVKTPTPRKKRPIKAARLAVIVHLAAVARDNGLDFPDRVGFHSEIKLLHLDFENLIEAQAWAVALGGPVMAENGRTTYVHYHSEVRDWRGYRIDIACLIPVDQVARVVTDTESSALVDSLLSDLDETTTR